MVARALLAGLWLAAAPLARAVTVDDFSVIYPGASGYVETGPLGTGQLSQPAINVLGGTRDTRVTATNPLSPTGVTIIGNPSPPPVKNVLEAVVGGGGGAVRLGYPALAGYDLTLGPGGNFPSSVEVLAALMVAGGTVELTLSDSTGGVGTATLPTADFFGGSPSGTAKYAFFPAAASFPGVDLTSIDELAVRVALPTGADFELTDIQIVPVATLSVDWNKAFAFEAAAGSGEPRVLVGFRPRPPSSGEPVLDLSDPVRPRIRWVGGIEPQPFLEVTVGAYGLGIDPHISPGQLELELTNASTYRMLLAVSSTGGDVLDPGSPAGFDPQPDAPSAQQFDWSMTPPDGQSESFGLQLALLPPMALAPETTGSVVLSFQILDPGGTPIPLMQVQQLGEPVPALPAWTALLLVALLCGLLLIRRRAQPSSDSARSRAE